MSQLSREDIRKLKEAKLYAKEAERRARKARKSSEDARQTIKTRAGELRQAAADKDVERVDQLTDTIEALLRKHVGPPKSTWREYAESIGLAIVFALILRAFVVEAFKIPTGSMIPTLMIGDHLFVNKFIYGLRVPFTEKYMVRFATPAAGDIVVFTFPRAEARQHLSKQRRSKRNCIDESSLTIEKDFIKRIVGVAGDTISVKDNRLIVNGKPVKRTHIKTSKTGHPRNAYQSQEREAHGGETYTIQYNGSQPKFREITVKEGNVFVMGDNRDNSSDSRCWGQVPVDNIKGKAFILWWSIDGGKVRWERIGDLIH